MEINKPHDWLAALAFQSDKSITELTEMGITPSTSKLEKRDYYKNINQVKEVFSDDSGEFNETKFNEFYNSALALYNNIDEEAFRNDIINTYEYSVFDEHAPKNGKIRKNTSVSLVSNPLGQSSGVVNLYQKSSPTISIRENAQTNFVWDTKNKKWLDWTPNDRGGLSGITRESLVLATWDEDGIHEIDGIQYQHQAGDYKVNDNKEYYYETLNGRELANKELLHFTDTLTVDGSVWNKYDMFDSDGIDKSVGGTVAKTLLSVGKYFIPKVGQAMAIMDASIQLSKLSPILFKSIEGIATNDTSEATTAANQLYAYASRFDPTKSDKGKQSMFTFEGLGDMVVSSSSQLFSQRLIGKIPKWLAGNKVTEGTINAGRTLSLAYMSGTSSIDSYQAFKGAGADERTAGLGVIATIGAMHTLMSQEYFQKLLFNGSYLDRTKSKELLLKGAQDIGVNAGYGAKEGAGWILKTKDAIVKNFSKLSASDWVSGSLSEGTEETMEEISSDIVKAVFSGMSYLGLVNNSKTLDFNFTAQDALSRYTTAYFGGAIGGAVFTAHNKFEKLSQSKLNKLTEEAIIDPNNPLSQLVYSIRNGKTSELRNELTRLYKKGKLGSKNLSGTSFEFRNSENNQELLYNSAEQGESQNDIVYNQMNQFINRIDDIINEEGLNFSDGDLEKITSIADSTNKSEDEIIKSLAEARKDQILKTLLESGVHSRIFEDWNNLTKDIITTKVSLETMFSDVGANGITPEDLVAKQSSLSKNKEYQTLSNKLTSLREKRDAIITGEQNGYYFGQKRFILSPNLVSAFVKDYGLTNYVRFHYGKDYNSLSEEDKEFYNNEYLEFSALEEKHKAFKAYDLFRQANLTLSPTINKAAEDVNILNKYKNASTLFTAKFDEIQEKLNILQDEISELDLQLVDEAISEEDKIKLSVDKNSKLEEINKINTSSTPFLLDNLTEFDNTIAFGDNKLSNYLDYLTYLSKNNIHGELVDSMFIQLMNNLNVGKREIDFYEVDSEAAIYLGNEEDSIMYYISLLNNSLLEGDLNMSLEYINEIYGIIYDKIQNDGEGLDPKESAEILLSHILPSEYNEFKKFLTDAIELKSKTKISPIFDLLKSLPLSIGGIDRNLVDLLEYEFKNIHSQGVVDYIIADKIVSEELKSILEGLQIVKAIISASRQDGFNSQMDGFKDNSGLFSTTLTAGQADSLLLDLGLIMEKVEYLLQISETNSNNKLKEQYEIGSHMRSKFGEILLGSKKDQINTAFNIDIDSIISDNKLTFPTSSITPENLGEYEYALSMLETKLFEEIENKNYSQHEIVTKILSLVDINVVANAEPTQLAKNTESITDYDIAIYLLSIIGYPTNNFNNDLKQIISNEDFKLAPIYSQENALRLAYSAYNNYPLFNTFIGTIKTILADSDLDPYLKNKPPLYNIFTIFGGTGTGKTKGVSVIFKQLCKNASIIASAPYKSQTERVADAIGVSTYKTRDDLLQYILGEPYSAEKHVEEDTHIETVKGEQKQISDGTVSAKKNLIFKPISDTLFDSDNKNKVLIIDEIGQYSKPQLEIISRWAYENQIFVLAVGDYKQTGISTLLNGDYFPSAIEDTLFSKSPNLTATLRADNIAKVENYIQLDSLLSKIWENFYKGEYSVGEASRKIDKLTKDVGISLKYFESDIKFGGEKLIESSEVDEEITKLLSKLNEEDTLVIITDKLSKYNKYKDDPRITVASSVDIAGAEFTYAVSDVNWAKHNGVTTSLLDILKNFYTLTQRSQKGTLIVNNKLKELLQVSHKLDNNTSSSVSANLDQIDKFKQWKLDILNTIPESLNVDRKIESDILNEENEDSQEERTDQEDNQEQSNKEQQIEVEETVENDQNTPQVPIPTLTTPSATSVLLPTTPSIPAVKGKVKTYATQQNNGYYVNGDHVQERAWNNEAVLNYFNNSGQGVPEGIFGTNYMRIIAGIRSLYLFSDVNNFDDRVKLFNKKYSKLMKNGLGNKYSIKSNLENRKVVKIGNNWYLVAEININDKIITIPLLPMPNNTPTGIFNGTIELAYNSTPIKNFENNGEISANLNNFYTSELNINGAFSIISDKDKLAIFTLSPEEKNNLQEKRDRGIKLTADENFRLYNSGKSLVLVSCDALASDKDFRTYLTVGNTATTMDYRFQLYGTQRRLPWDINKIKSALDQNSGIGFTNTTVTALLRRLKDSNSDLFLVSLKKMMGIGGLEFVVEENGDTITYQITKIGNEYIFKQNATEIARINENNSTEILNYFQNLKAFTKIYWNKGQKKYAPLKTAIHSLLFDGDPLQQNNTNLHTEIVQTLQELFPRGISINDSINDREALNSWKTGTQTNEHGIDVSEFKLPNFKLTGTIKIDNEETIETINVEQELLNDINTQLKKNALTPIKKLEEVQEVLNIENKRRKNTSKFIIYPLVLDNNKIIQTERYNGKFIAQVLNINENEINKIEKHTSNPKIFFVSLHNGDIKILYNKINGFIEIKTNKEYIQLDQFLMQNSIPESEYLNKLLNLKNISESDYNEYVNMKNNLDKNIEIALDSLVLNYLIEKIKNNEC